MIKITIIAFLLYVFVYIISFTISYNSTKKILKEIREKEKDTN